MHAATHLADELRTLVRTWRALRVDISIGAEQRTRMERQTAQEVLETHQALELIGRSMGAAPRFSTKDVEEVAHIIGTIGRST